MTDLRPRRAERASCRSTIMPACQRRCRRRSPSLPAPAVACLAVACLAVACLSPSVARAADPCEDGRRLFLENNYVAAEPLLKECLEAKDSLLALLPLTMITTVQGRVPEALAYGGRALALGPDNVNVRYWYGRALLASGDRAQAQVQWEQGLALDSRHGGILEGLAQLNSQQGEFARAYNLLQQLKLQGVGEPWLHRQLSGLARRKGQWAVAVGHWRDAIAVEGETAENLVVLGELSILAGQPEEAVPVFRRAVELQPSGQTWGGLGEAYFTTDQVDSAAAALRRAVVLEPENARHRFNLANALELLEQADQAEQQFRAYLDLRPDDPVGRFHYGVHLERRGRPEQAVAQVAEAVRLDPRYGQAMVVLASLHEQLGALSEALAVVEALLALDAGSGPELRQWQQALQRDLAEAKRNLAGGKVHLLHIVTSDANAVAAIAAALEQGTSFAEVAARYSQGPTAVRGGDVGWVDPAQMLPALREAIKALAPGATCPPVEAGGQWHVFRRVQ